jgi:glyoxylase-like metal-dependent hydrolase (beta-lactamase superfamily II)
MRLTAITTTIIAASLAAGTHAQEAEVSLKATEVYPGLTMLVGEGGFTGGNVTLMTGDDAIVLIDDGTEPYGELYLAAVNKHAERPVDFVINTHAHGDHVGANRALHMSGATIVAHNNIRKRLIESGFPTAGGTRPVEPAELPQITFSDAVTFYLNDRTAHVMHVPNAHTDGDAFIHFRDINVISAGDVLFNGLFPYIDLDSGGSVAGYLAAQGKLLALADDETKIIPGHGPLATKSDLLAAHKMLVDANDRIKALVDAGRSEEEIVTANPLADYHDDWNWGFITTERMTRTLYRSNSSGA